jgi:hypothetical protein
VRVSTQTIADHTAEYIRLIEKHGPATATELSEMTTGRKDLAAVDKVRYRMRTGVERGYFTASERDDRQGGIIYDVNPDKTNRLALAYTVKEQLANEIEDAIVDALTETPGLGLVELSNAVGPRKRPWMMSSFGMVTPPMIDKFCGDLVERKVLTWDASGYYIRKGKK